MRLALFLICLCCAAAQAAETQIEIAQGDYTPVMAPGPARTAVHVSRFRLDRLPVTRAEYRAFVVRHPEWRRGQVPGLFADQGYLADWPGPLDSGAGLDNTPVTGVSWYAARAYCAELHQRLPTWAEWEYVAAADATRRDARDDPAWREVILSWYAQSSARPPGPVGRHAPNVYGIQDLHGLVWEWVEDFAGLLVSGDSRNQGDPERATFCGAGALSAGNRDDYPVLMRIAFLSALQANYATAGLGLRCAGDMP